MSDTQQVFEQALDLAAKQGNVEAARAIVEDMRRNMRRGNPSLGMPEPVKLGQENMPASIQEVAKESGVASQRMAGIGTAPALAGHGIAQLAGADNGADVQNWQALKNATPDTQMGNLAGNAAMYASVPTRALSPVLSGATKAAPWLKPVAEAAGSRWGNVLDTGVTQGVVNAATTPGNAQERIVSGLLGAGGAAAPMGVAAAQTTRRATTLQGKQLALAEALRKETGDSTPALIAQLDANHYPTSRIGVQPSAAMLTRNPSLEVMESGSRVRTPDLWMNFDRANATARWQKLEEAAGSPQELAKLKAARDALTSTQREAALAPGLNEYGPLSGNVIAPLDEKLTALASGANRPNKDVQTLVGYVRGELGQGVTPEQLYTVRKMLTDGIKAGPTSELSQAARAARPQRMEIISEIDKTLNEISGGKWQTYLDTYKAASPEITSKGALQNIVADLKYGRPAGEVPASMGERPSPFALGRLRDRYGTKEFGAKEIDQLSPAHRELVDALVSDLNAQSGTMLPRATLGSPTASNLANAGRVDRITNGAIDAAGNAIPLVGGTVAASLKGSLGRRSEEALATLLKDPVALAEALRRAAKADKLLKESGQVGAGAGAAVRASKE